MINSVDHALRIAAMLQLEGELTDEELETVYPAERYADRPADRPDLDRLRAEPARVRRNGFVLNQGRSERGVVALGVPLRAPDGDALAGLSVSMPSGRYDRHRLPSLVDALSHAAGAIEADLARSV
ncbi:IclR family transcriptional regulator C-terminal domain-containing protein [Streptosporangium sp. NPDC005286]|uniref:IclR family transcriptional regulator domain-containing protein n=1 Tax=Streptosporangium sp. NPDC005286 TaxID=3154463 RepID=UPI0033B74052